ncbi:MAG: hypothetical protein KC445_20985 [Anaerolineales bacterium]|nr:hypothetical protein [Anaerolineales bacterium]
MQYTLLIYSNERQDQDRSPEAMQAEMGEWFAYTKALRDSGAYVAGEALQPTGTATTVRRRDERLLTTDGPFAETKEQLGGFYIIDCETEADALEMAAKMPMLAGSVEVRPVIEF